MKPKWENFSNLKIEKPLSIGQKKASKQEERYSDDYKTYNNTE